MTLEQIIRSYGALGVLAGTFFEGEAIVILAAFAAHQGYLPLWEVILAAFVGACLGDQFYFYLGRSQGRALLARRPALQSRVEKAMRLFERFHVWIILGIRYCYGLRSVLCISIGMSRVSSWTFAVLNAIGVALWAVLTGLGGYYFGRALTILLGDVKKYELAVLAAVAAGFMAIWLWHWLRQKKR